MEWIVEAKTLSDFIDHGRYTISSKPLIRCRDCKHWEYDAIFPDGWCRGKQQGNPEWFCADAERRTDETD